MLGIFYLRHHRPKGLQSGRDTNDPAHSSRDTQPYLQPKAELEAAKTRRLELEAAEVRYEIDGEDDRHEMPGTDVENEIDTVARPGMSSLKQQHELRGEESFIELEAPSSKQEIFSTQFYQRSK